MTFGLRPWECPSKRPFRPLFQWRWMHSTLTTRDSLLSLRVLKSLWWLHFSSPARMWKSCTEGKIAVELHKFTSLLLGTEPSSCLFSQHPLRSTGKAELDARFNLKVRVRPLCCHRPPISQIYQRFRWEAIKSQTEYMALSPATLCAVKQCHKLWLLRWRTSPPGVGTIWVCFHFPSSCTLLA